MELQRDKIVIVDIEATCWEAGTPIPPGERSEIIEIGVCLLDGATYEPSHKRSILVRPERSKVGPFCTQLTTLTQEQVDKGVSFAEACAILKNSYGTENRLWGSWGSYDRRMFTEQCESFDVAYPFSGRHANIKQVFAKLHGHKRTGMAGALALAELPLEGTHHRGGDDAWNIARLLQYMFNRFGPRILRKY